MIEKQINHFIILTFGHIKQQKMLFILTTDQAPESSGYLEPNLGNDAYLLTDGVFRALKTQLIRSARNTVPFMCKYVPYSQLSFSKWADLSVPAGVFLGLKASNRLFFTSSYLENLTRLH